MDIAMLSRVLALLAIAFSLSTGPDVPPRSLVRENISKASIIVRGEIEGSETLRPGVTVAHFRVSDCYRGPFKRGDEISYASFREDDRYSNKFIRVDLIVFLRARAKGFAPPDLETATDVSEFLYTGALADQLPKHSRRTDP
jgi:hypothetical protein